MLAINEEVLYQEDHWSQKKGDREADVDLSWSSSSQIPEGGNGVKEVIMDRT